MTRLPAQLAHQSIVSSPPALTGKIGGMTSHPNLDQLNPEQLRVLAAQLIQRVETMDKQITHHKSVNEKLAHEIALLKRFKFAKRSEQLSPDQASLLDDLIDTDIAAIEAELEALQPTPVEAKVHQQPKRASLPSQFPRKVTVLCPSTITGARIKSDRGLLDARTGCSRVRYTAESRQRRS
jgi:hypothetical protein